MPDTFTEIFDLKIFNRSKTELLSILKEKLSTKSPQKPLVLFTPNAEQVVLAEKDRQFKKHLQKAEVLIADGTSLVLASKIFAAKDPHSLLEPIQERITGIDLVQDILKMIQEKKWNVLVLGGRNLIKDASRDGMEFEWLEGYKKISLPTEQEEKKVLQTLQRLRPEILFVAFGAPSQEKWVIEHLPLLEKSGVKLAMVVGGAFDVLTGKVARAPKWMQALGLEWLFRLIQEPWRWRRQLQLFEFWKMVLQKM